MEYMVANVATAELNIFIKHLQRAQHAVHMARFVLL
jgi:hypothetical protein